MSKLLSENPNVDHSSSFLAAGTIIIGKIIDIDEHGRPLVIFNENPSGHPLVALATLSITKNHISRQIALLFNNGDPGQPVIMGLIHNPLDELLDNFELSSGLDNNDDIDPFIEIKDIKTKQAGLKGSAENKVYVDGKQVCIEGAEEVSLKCGKASITLTKSGKILIRGTYLLNRSSGVNRIMGGSVQVN